MEFTIRGRIVPYVRMTQRSKWADPRARLYLDSQAAIRWQLTNQMLTYGWQMLPERESLVVTVAFDIGKRLHTTDCDNMAKAVIDAAQGVVYANDAWIDQLHVYRRQMDNMTENTATMRVALLA